MRPLSDTPPFTCATCEAPTPAEPTIHLGLPFCCAGCAAGGPCTCSYDSFDPEVTDAANRVDPPAIDDSRRLVGATR